MANLLLFFFLCFQAEKESVEIAVSKNSVLQGDIFIVDVSSSSDNGSLAGRWNDSRVLFFPYPPENPTQQRGLVGVDVYMKPGSYPLTIYKESTGEEVAKVAIEVADGKFPTSRVKVPRREGKPDPELEKRIAREKAKVTEVLEGFVPDLFLDGSFDYPLASATITSPFGARRILFDGVSSRDSYHRGVDFRAAIGTPIKASNGGQVAYVADHVLEGNFVILHHGANLFTSYLHLSGVKVKEGQKVQKGDLIGYSGNSGNSRGPHLHWAAAVGGVRVNPLRLFEISRF